jgi:hypothetical protein
LGEKIKIKQTGIIGILNHIKHDWSYKYSGKTYYEIKFNNGKSDLYLKEEFKSELPLNFEVVVNPSSLLNEKIVNIWFDKELIGIDTQFYTI